MFEILEISKITDGAGELTLIPKHRVLLGEILAAAHESSARTKRPEDRC
jgi:hypothetical protein